MLEPVFLNYQTLSSVLSRATNALYLQMRVMYSSTEQHYNNVRGIE